MTRKYIAVFDTGTDYTNIEYASKHRNRSKANADDASTAAQLQAGN